MEKQDHKVCKVFQEQWGHLVIRVLLENKDKKGILESLDHQDQEVILVKMGFLVLQEPEDLLVPVETVVLQGHLVLEDSRACQDQLVKMVWQEKMEKLVFRECQG
jgi:hypothetical protein